MTREDYLPKYKKEVEETIETSRLQFTKHLTESADQLRAAVLDGFEKLSAQAEEQQKEYLMFFYFSYLNIDLLNDKFNIVLQGMDSQWYLDPDIAEITFDLDFLLLPLLSLAEDLTNAFRKCMGCVNEYDARHLLLEEMAFHNKSIAHLLRCLLSDLEEEEVFQRIPKGPYFIIRWGSYRDDTQIVLLRDRDGKDQKQWNAALKAARKKREDLAVSYWYEAELKESDCRSLMMQFITFEKCSLENFDFHSADLTRANFKETRLKDCRFSGCCLEGADFRRAELEHVDFKDANLKNAMFRVSMMKDLELTDEQLQDILVEKETEERNQEKSKEGTQEETPEEEWNALF